MSITGCTDSSISDSGTATGLWAELSVADVQVEAGKLLMRHNMQQKNSWETTVNLP